VQGRLYKYVLLTVQMCLECNRVGIGLAFSVMISKRGEVGGKGGKKQVFIRLLKDARN
jgi:hypothetical protein